MPRLHRGHPRWTAFAGAALALVLVPGLVAGLAGPAGAETLGGEQLSRTHRTVSPLPGADPLPEVWAETWILADAETGEVLAQKGSHVQRPPASTLKMLTALTVMPNTSPQDVYVATPRAAGIYGARVGLRVGRSYTMDQLWYAVFLPSANDAAIAVAEANGGVRRTIRQMNDVAQGLNARDTVARNTSGLDAPRQLSSAYDLALFARAGLQRPDFASYASTARAEFPDVKGKGSHAIYTTNRLLLSGWKGVIGVKTGFTSQAGRTYVGAAKRGGRTLIVSLMGIKESSEAAAKKLLTWGFANRDKVTPIGILVEPGELAEPVEAAADDAGTDASPMDETSVRAATAADPAEATTMPIAVPILAALLVLAAATLAVARSRRSSATRGRHAA